MDNAVGISNFILDNLVFPVYDVAYEIMFNAINSVMNGGLIRASPDLDPKLSRYGKGSRLFLNYLIITLGSVVASALAIRLWILWDQLRK